MAPRRRHLLLALVSALVFASAAAEGQGAQKASVSASGSASGSSGSGSGSGSGKDLHGNMKLWPNATKIPMMVTKEQASIDAFNQRLYNEIRTNPAHLGDVPQYLAPDTSAHGLKPEHYKHVVESFANESNTYNKTLDKGNKAPDSWSVKKPGASDKPADDQEGSGSSGLEPDTREQHEKDGGFNTWFMPEEFTKPWGQEMNQQLHNQLAMSQSTPGIQGGPVVPYKQLDRVYSQMHGMPPLYPEATLTGPAVPLQ
jgi:hypothetical protein